MTIPSIPPARTPDVTKAQAAIGFKWASIVRMPKLTKSSVLSLVVLCVANSVASAAPANGAPSLKCENGPVSKALGGTQWLVYGCADGRSMVAVSAPGSPAFPFYFMVFAGKGGYEIVGEGTGQKEVTAAAHSDLKALSDEEIKSLVAEAGRVQK